MSNTQNYPYDDDRGKTDVAKEHAAGLKDHALGAGQDLGGTAKAEAKGVARDAKNEIRGLLDTALGESRGQLRGGQSKLAAGVRSLSSEVKEMAEGGTQDGQASQLARTLASTGDDLAGWIENTEPQDVVDNVRRYAARNPITFLAIAAGAGLLVGRFARGFQAEQADQGGRGAYDDYRRSDARYTQATYDRTPTAPAYSDYSARDDYDQSGQYTSQSGQGYTTEPGQGYTQSGYDTTTPGYQAEPGAQGQSWQNQSGTAYDTNFGDRR
ncbi:hypothetical protein [Mariniluteicoccus flavus]